MQKGQGLIFVIVGILVAAIIAGGAYYLGRSTSPQPSATPNIISQTPQPSPSPDETVYTESDRSANWKTYTSTKYEFELKYPSNLELANGSVDYIFYIQTTGWSTNKATLPTSYQIAITYLKDKAYTPEEYMELDSDKIPPLPKPDFMQTTTNGIPTIIKTYRDESHFAWGGNKQYYLYQKNKSVILDGSGKNHQILDQIIPTFKFL